MTHGEFKELYMRIAAVCGLVIIAGFAAIMAWALVRHELAPTPLEPCVEAAGVYDSSDSVLSCPRGRIESTPLADGHVAIACRCGGTSAGR